MQIKRQSPETKVEEHKSTAGIPTILAQLHELDGKTFPTPAAVVIRHTEDTGLSNSVFLAIIAVISMYTWKRTTLGRGPETRGLMFDSRYNVRRSSMCLYSKIY